MDNKQRQSMSDAKAEPLLWYVYIRELEVGTFYIGQTNDLPTRNFEHRVGGGAKATSTQDSKLVWFNHCHSRDAAENLEKRLQGALERSPLDIRGIVDRFQSLMKEMFPPKTLAELREDEQTYESEMRRSFHLTRMRAPFVHEAACGWLGETYGTGDPETLLQLAREHEAIEAVGGQHRDRRPCKSCLSIASG